jgi:hypothetical protein
MHELVVAMALACLAVLLCVVGLMGSGRTPRAWLTAIGGYTLLGITSFVLMPALDERTALQAANASLKHEIERLKQPDPSSSTQCDDKRPELAAAQFREQRILEAIRRIPVTMRVPPAEADPLNATEPEGRAIAIVAAITQIDGLLAKHARPVEPQATAIRKWLAGSPSNDYFVIEYVGQDLVEGQRGDYYRIKFKADRAWALEFQTGQYVLEPRAVKSLEQAAERLASDVLAHLPTGVMRMLYIRGNATARPWGRGELVVGHEYQDIAVIPGSATAGYKFGFSCFRTSKPPRNEDLPNLRAAFVQSVLGRAKGFGLPAILEGRPADRQPAANETEVEIFLRIEG